MYSEKYLSENTWKAQIFTIAVKIRKTQVIMGMEYESRKEMKWKKR